MTADQVALRRLRSQRLVGSRLTTPVDVVDWLGAVQAQDYTGAKWGIGMRLKDATDAAVEQAFSAGAIIRTHVLRPTWHLVAAADVRWLLRLTAPHVHARNARVYRKLGLDGGAFRRSEAAFARALRGGRSLTRVELRQALRRARVPAGDGVRMAFLLMHAELEGLVCSGPRRGKQFTYALLDERVPATGILGRDAALVELAHRFFTSRGPATLDDFARWSGLPKAAARNGLEGAARRFEREVVDGGVYWRAPSAERVVRGGTATAHLLSIYDEYMSGYKDRRAMVSASIAARLQAMDSAVTHLVVVNGLVVGAWTRVFRRGAVAVSLDVLKKLAPAERRAVESAIQAYADFFGAVVDPHHQPSSFHQTSPTPSQIARFTSDIRNPTRHQARRET